MLNKCRGVEPSRCWVVETMSKGLLRVVLCPNEVGPLHQKYQPSSGSEGLCAISCIQALHSHLRYAHKTHYRIVFKEKGITIDCIKSLPDVMTVLTETVRGAFPYDAVHISALTLSLCSFTAVAEVGMGTL